MYLNQNILNIKSKDKERFNLFKKEKKFLDSWAEYSFYDFSIIQEERSKKGSFYTPEWIVRLMVKNSFKILKEKNIDLKLIKILEPSCGSGNFLQILIEELHNETNLNYSDIVSKNIYCIDVDSEAIFFSKKRIKELFDVELVNIFCEDALFFNSSIHFDLIIGNPPYGNLLDKNAKEKINDHYNNIALNFLDHFFNLLSPNGLLYFIVPHSFSRAGQGALKWRNKLIENKSLFEIIDVGNPFFDITLEQIIVGLTKSKNFNVITNSIRYNKIGNIIPYKEIFNNEEKIILIYYDDFYLKVKNSNPVFPFFGKRGKDFNKKELLTYQEANSYWIILGKNITKNGVKHINKYDRYTINSEFVFSEEYVAITQFGINLKASLVPPQTIPSGGIVVISHQGLSNKEAITYLNKSTVNEYLQKYILNGAELTVHLDGKYLKQIPYSMIL